MTFLVHHFIQYSLIAGLLIAPAPLSAKEKGNKDLPAESDTVLINKYTACMKLTKTDPEKAFNMALAWTDTGTFDAAQHCLAASLMALKHYSEAAVRFENLAKTVKAEPDIKGKLLGNAAQAWLLAEKPARAEAALTAGIELDPHNPALYVDRATMRADQGLYQEAVDDLNEALNRNPADADAYTFRGSARRRLDQMPAAMADVSMALKINPNHTEALLERGIIYHHLGKNDEARNDWMRILEIDPESGAADAVRQNLEQMDYKVPGLTKEKK